MVIGVLADDLSGALASAAALRHHGLRTVVQWHDRSPDPGVDAVVIDMRTRDLTRDAAEHAGRWAAWLTEHGAERLELRIDSTLRGKTRGELEGVLATLPGIEPWVLAVPAFPQAGRTTRDGIQYVDGRPSGSPPVTDCLFDGPAAVVEIATIEAGADAVVDLLQDQAAAGVTRFVADGEHDGHLHTLALAAGRLRAARQPLVTLSPGAWLRHHPAYGDVGLAVVVLGSATDVNQQGLEVLRRQASTSLIDACGRARGDAIQGATRVAVVETVRSGAHSDPEDLSPRAAAVAADLLDRLHAGGRHVTGVIASGGHTAACLLEHLRPDAVRPVGELAPLCPLGVLEGGRWPGLPLVTKGGLIGTKDTLTQLVTALQQENPCPTPDLVSH